MGFDGKETIPLPNAYLTATILKQVIAWCEHQEDDFHRSTVLDIEANSWNTEFFKDDMGNAISLLMVRKPFMTLSALSNTNYLFSCILGIFASCNVVFRMTCLKFH
jgi:hypothetical protein